MEFSLYLLSSRQRRGINSRPNVRSVRAWQMNTHVVRDVLNGCPDELVEENPFPAAFLFLTIFDLPRHVHFCKTRRRRTRFYVINQLKHM